MAQIVYGFSPTSSFYGFMCFLSSFAAVLLLPMPLQSSYCCPIKRGVRANRSPERIRLLDVLLYRIFIEALKKSSKQYLKRILGTHLNF